jgi:protein-arginine kinase activator protein McsA
VKKKERPMFTEPLTGEEMMMWILTLSVVVGPLLALLGGWLITIYLRRRRASAANRAVDGCLACGSTELETIGHRVLCNACGYEGRADQGGEISAREAGASVEHLGRKVATVLRNAHFE